MHPLGERDVTRVDGPALFTDLQIKPNTVNS